MFNIKQKLSDCSVMTNRALKHILRNPENFTIVLILPIVLLLLFVFVFGGAMDTGEIKYIDYVASGVIVLCITQCSAITAVAVTSDIQNGIVERFKSLPIYRPSILVGYFISSMLKNIMTSAVLFAVAFMAGLKVKADFGQWLTIVGILILFSMVLTLVSMFIGLITKNPDAATGYGFIMNVLPYLSSAFAPTDSMNKVVKAFVENQPLTHVIDSVRFLFLGTYDEDSLKLTFIWLVGLFIAFSLAVLVVFKKKMR